jgi:hypothetical protein
VTWLKEIAAKSNSGVLLFRDKRYIINPNIRGRLGHLIRKSLRN